MFERFTEQARHVVVAAQKQARNLHHRDIGTGVILLALTGEGTGTSARALALWWGGEIIGSWAVAATGEVRVKLVADRGTEARDAIQDAAARLHDRLDGAVITPAIRTLLERSLA